jgi:hypothetical protein
MHKASRRTDAPAISGLHKACFVQPSQTRGHSPVRPRHVVKTAAITTPGASITKSDWAIKTNRPRQIDFSVPTYRIAASSPTK